MVCEFWAEWNEKNCISFIDEIDDCSILRVNVDNNVECMKAHDIGALPTVVIFDGDEEVFRWEADISFKLEVEQEEIQEKIDEIILEKF